MLCMCQQRILGGILQHGVFSGALFSAELKEQFLTGMLLPVTTGWFTGALHFSAADPNG